MRRVLAILLVVLVLAPGPLMATDWNPNASEVLGLEWMPTVRGTRAIDSPGKAATMTFRSRDADNPDHIYLHLPESRRRNTSQANWLLEVYEEGDEIPGAVTTETFYPNAVIVNSANAWKNAAAATLATANVAAAIGETTGLDTADYAQYTGTYQAKSPLELNFGTAAWGANRRVVGGRIVIVANREEASGQVRVSWAANMGSGFGNYNLGTITTDTEMRTFEVPFPEVNPLNGEPWIQSLIQDLDGADGAIRFKPVGIGKHKPLRIFQVYLELDYVTENRVASGIASFSAGGDWIPFNASFTKVIDTTYTLLLRRVPRWAPNLYGSNTESWPTEGGSVAWGYLEESAAVADALGRERALPDPYMASSIPVLNADGTVANMRSPGVRGYGFYLDDGGVINTDGQPYVVAANYGLSSLYSGVGVAQEFLGVAATYDTARLLVSAVTYVDALTLATADAATIAGMADITVTVKLDSTNAVVGTPVTITAADVLAADPIQAGPVDGRFAVYPIEVDLVGVTPTAAKHYIEFTTTQPQATIAGDGAWGILALATEGQGDEATYGGVTYAVGVTDESDVTARDEGVDLAVILSQQPDAPEDFSTTIAAHSLITDTQALTAEFLVRDIEYVSVSWSATGLGPHSGDLIDHFVRYEIQRSQDGGVTWEDIAWITDEAVEEFRDEEGLFNVEATYRMRVVASWLVASAWTVESSETPELAQCALVFSSNEDPRLTQGYMDIGPEREWTFLSGDERETHVLVGRNYQVVTSPLEYRGDRFTASLALWAGSTPVDTGRAHFDLLESLNQAATSYICVRDETGRRWFADVAITTGKRRGPNVHTAEADVIEVTDVPSLVDVSSSAS